MKGRTSRFLLCLVASLLLAVTRFPLPSATQSGSSTHPEAISQPPQTSEIWSMSTGEDMSTTVGIAGARMVELVPRPDIAPDESIVLTQVPLGRGGTADFELQAFDVFTPEARVVAMTDGVETPLPRPHVQLYSGRSLNGDAGSIFLSVKDAEFRAVIQRGDEMTYIWPVSLGGSEATHIVVAGDSLPLPDFDTFCSSDRVPENVARALARPRSQKASALTSDRLEADLMIDVDNGLYSNVFGGSTARASEYVANLFGAVTAIYERDLNVQLRISTLTIWTTPDPFGGTDSLRQLQNYRDYVRANRLNVSRDIAHLLDDQQRDGGIAYIETLCNPSFGYAVSNIYGDVTFPASGYVWDIFVTAHEVGHNFGSVHTHCFIPPIDMCYGREPTCYSGASIPSIGTIMSYCHLTISRGGGVTLNFHPRCIEVMRPTAEAASCLEAANQPPGMTLPLTSGVPRSDSIPAPPPDSCLLGPTQYTILVPTDVNQLRVELSGNQNLDLFVRSGQRVTIQDDQVMADYESRSATGTESLDITPSSSPPLQSGTYYMAVLNCGPGEAAFTVTATVAGQTTPDIEVTPTSVDFGTVLIGQSADRTLTVSNVGTAPLVVNGFTFGNAQFAWVSPKLPFTVDAGRRQTVTLRFTPAAAGPQTGTLNMSSNDPDEATVSVELRGAGTTTAVPDIDVTPTSLDFGSVTIGQSADRTLTVRNTGSAPLTVNTITSHNPRFSLVSPTGSFTVAAGNQQTVTARFAPTTAETHSGTLSIASDDPDEATVMVNLTGQGAPPPSRMLSVPVRRGDPGQTLTIPVMLSEGAGLSALQFTLGFDPAVISLSGPQAITAGPLVPSNFSISTNTNTPGQVRVVISPPITLPIPSLNSGSGPVIQLTFQISSTASAGATSPLMLSNISGSDASASAISVNPQNGSVTVNGLLRGDVNQDGVVNVQDLIRLLQHLNGEPLLTGDGLLAADLNEDGQVNTQDLILLIELLTAQGLLSDLLTRETLSAQLSERV